MDGLITQAMLHRQQRDGVAWALEWHALPQICMASAKALALALDLVRELQPNAAAMEARLSSGSGLVYAEAISFKLAEIMPRPEAQDQVKRLCAQALEQDCSLSQLVAQNYPDTNWSAITTRQHNSATHQTRHEPSPHACTSLVVSGQSKKLIVTLTRNSIELYSSGEWNSET